MIVEERVYTLKHGKVAEYLKYYETVGRSIQLRHLGCNLGYYTVDIGPQNQIVHLWAYESHSDREERRSALKSDPAWSDYLRLVKDLMLVQDTKILKPAPFFSDHVAVLLG